MKCIHARPAPAHFTRCKRSAAIVAQIIKQIIFGLLLLTIFQEGVMAQTIIEEANLIRQKDKSAILDIKELALKYIPIGTPESKAIDYLKSQGFKVYKVEKKYLKNSPTLDSAFNCVYKIENNGKSFQIFFDEIEVSIGIKNGLVISVSGRIINRAF